MLARLRAGVFALATVAVGSRTVPVSNATLATRACRPGFQEHDFCNTSLPIAARVAALIASLRDDEVGGTRTVQRPAS